MTSDGYARIEVPNTMATWDWAGDGQLVTPTIDVIYTTEAPVQWGVPLYVGIYLNNTDPVPAYAAEVKSFVQIPAGSGFKIPAYSLQVGISAYR